MFGNWDTVGDIQKGVNDLQEQAQQGMHDAGQTHENVQHDTQNATEEFGENVSKGVNNFGDNSRQFVEEKSGDVEQGLSDAQGGVEEASQNVVKCAEDVGKNAKQGIEEARGNVEKGLDDAWRAVEEPLRKLAETVEDIVNSTLPGAGSMDGSPYEHVPGNPPHESILLSADLLVLKDGCVLRGICQKADGSWAPSEIDLNSHYGCAEGSFVAGGDGYVIAGRDFTLERTRSSALLKGQFNNSGNWVDAEVDLSLCIVVRDGGFVFEKHDGPWDRDGVVARQTERIPVAGYIIAAIQSANDNPDHAQRALAVCTSSTLITVAALAGSLIDGPFAAGIAAGLSTPLANLAESLIAHNMDDPRLRAAFEEATVGRAITEAIQNAFWGAAVGEALHFVGEWLSTDASTMVRRAIDAIKDALSGASLGLAQDAIDAHASGSEAAAIAFIGKIVQVLWKAESSPIDGWNGVRELVEGK